MDYITENIKRALDSDGVRFYAKNFLREGLTKDCVDAVQDAELVAKLLRERMDLILNKDYLKI